MNYPLILFVILIGGGLSAQAAMNSRLRETIHQPILAALISFLIGIIALGAIALTGWQGRAKWDNLANMPWWAWFGGLIGAIYVTTAVIAVPRIGAAMLICCAVCGQMIAALAIDSFGLLDLPRVPLNPWRLLGAVLLLAGVVLMQRK